jgi:hypothetical protein
VRTAAAVIAVAIGAAWFVAGPIAQDPAYHRFADTRAVLGVPNGLDVLSNLGFAIVGLAGLALTVGPRARGRFGDHWTRVPWATLFGGTLLTAAGSSYYHLAPDDARLVWDRLPMTVAFMGLLSAVLAERVGVAAARRAFAPLLVFGAGSVFYWYATEVRGAGDLRPYALVQFGTLAAIVAILARRRGPRPDARFLAAGLVAYAAAKALEAADAEVLAVTGAVSGHSLKHVVAAAGIACLAAEIARRRRDSKVGAGHDPCG